MQCQKLINNSLVAANDTTGLSWKWITTKPGGARPPPRSGVSIATGPNGKVYAFGGVLDVDEDEETLEGNCSNDLNLLDLTNQKWRPVELSRKSEKAKGKADEPIADEIQTASGSGTAYQIILKHRIALYTLSLMFHTEVSTEDGVFTMSVGEPSKNVVKSSEEGAAQSTKKLSFPSPRMKCGMAVCKGHLYVYGGEVEQGKRQLTLNDLYSLGKTIRINHYPIIIIWFLGKPTSSVYILI